MPSRKPPVLILRCSWCFELFPWKPLKASKIKNGPKLCCSRGHLNKLQAREIRMTKIEQNKVEQEFRDSAKGIAGLYRTIALSQGYVAIVDESDYGWLSQWIWHASRKVAWHQPYAYRSATQNGRTITFAMHREILGLTRGDKSQVDHINRDHLDNRRANLRIVTPFENQQNVGIRKNNKSGFPGVYQETSTGKWRARKEYDGRITWLGRHDSKEAAIAAWKEFNDTARARHI